MDNAAGAEVLEAIAASALRLAGVLRGTVDISTGGDLAGSSVPVGVPATCPSAGVAASPPVSTARGPADGPVPGAFAAGPFAAGSDPLRWQAEACLTVLSGAAGLEAMVAAVKVHAADGYDEAAQVIAGPIMSPQEQTAQEMGIVAEVACALTVSERAAGGMVPGRFRAKARTWRERHHPVSIETRHTRSVMDRRVEYAPDRDGMAWLSAYLPAGQASGIWNRATTAARALQGPTEGRTLTQLRADNVAAWLLGGDNADDISSPAAQVLVTVPVFALMGLTDEPAVLDGYGPIPPSMARQLVANGAESFRRVLTDPRDGAPLEIGRECYRIPKALRQWLRLRDGKCQFPGCSNQSLDNEADHLNAWANGGSTGISNLAQLCPKHHRLKHTRPWQPTEATTDEPPGWISPTGRHYQSEQPDPEPPHWPGAAVDAVQRFHDVQGFPGDPWALSNDQPPRVPVPLE